jgi:hypothetical protein
MNGRRHIQFMIVLFLAALALPAFAYSRKASIGKAKKKLNRALAANNEAAIQSAITSLGEVDTVAAAKIILQVTAQRRDFDLSGYAIEALASTKSKSVKAFLLKSITKNKIWWLRYLLIDVCDKINDVDAHVALEETIKDKHSIVLQHLADIYGAHKNAEAVDRIIDILGRAEALKVEHLQKHILNLLKNLVGHELVNSQDWRSWWSSRRKSFDFSKPLPKKEKAKGSSTVSDNLKSRGDDKYISEIAEGDVVVVEGKYDKIQDVLKGLKVPFKLIKKPQLKSLRFKSSMVLIFNCDDKGIDQNMARTITSFVKSGGYIFTSDYEVRNVLTHSFPKYVAPKTGGSGKVTGIPNLKHLVHPYLRDVFGPYNPYGTVNKVSAWKDIDTWDLPQIINPSRVLPLVVSQKNNKQGQLETVVLTFRHGLGSVLHVLGHYAEQVGSPDGFARRQLLANFIVEKQKFRRHLKAARKKKK